MWATSVCTLVGVLALLSGSSNKPDQQPADIAFAAVDRHVRAPMDWRLIPGLSIAVVQNGELRYTAGFGVANKALNTPVTPETVFHTGSVGKPFTAIAVLKLVERGLLTLDQPVARFFQGDQQRSLVGVTIRDLLSHTSGLQNYVSEIKDVSGEYSEAKLLGIITSQPKAFAPGTGYRYSNSGYVLLGVIVERVSGKHLGDFLRDEMLGPLGMSATVMAGRSLLVERLAQGYRVAGGELEAVSKVSTSLNSTGDGSLLSTVLDLVKWDAGLDEDSLLGRPMRDAMWTPVRLKNGTTHQYGFGWGLRVDRGHPVVEHGGIWQGFSAHIARYPSDRVSVAVLTNLSGVGDTPGQIARRVARYFIPSLRHPEWTPSRSVSMPTKALDDYTGEYEVGTARVRIWRDGDTLFVTGTGRGRGRMRAVSATEFVLDEVGGLSFRFVQSPEKLPTLIVRDSKDQPAKRIR